MTITLNWNATSTRTNAVVILTASTTIYIWAPTALTNLSTFQATVAAVCLVGILGLCCLGCLNSVGVKYFRRYNVLMARLTRDEQECEQSRDSSHTNCIQPNGQIGEGEVSEVQ